MPSYLVTFTGRLEPVVDPEAAVGALMEELGERGQIRAKTVRRGHELKVEIPIEARTQAHALQNASSLLRKALAGEPLTHLAARVAPQ